MRADYEFVGGHDALAVERFLDDTRHVIIFDVISGHRPWKRMRLFLNDRDYAQALDAEKARRIVIRKHANIVEGHILEDRKKRRR